jgi:hypothetical protein
VPFELLDRDLSDVSCDTRSAMLGQRHDVTDHSELRSADRKGDRGRSDTPVVFPAEDYNDAQRISVITGKGFFPA